MADKCNKKQQQLYLPLHIQRRGNLDGYNSQWMHKDLVVILLSININILENTMLTEE